MAFVDELKIFLEAGRGGDGVVRWRHEKYKEFAGPSGGNGGWGGNVVIKAVRDISRLARYAHFTELSAGAGGHGEENSKTGRNGDDLVLELPIGSVIKNIETGDVWELIKEGDSFQILKGGKGGLGNEHFKGSRNTTPTENTEGKIGLSGHFRIELRLIADVGLIGFPNAGKSTLLNELTNAKSKIAPYQFTTLEPHLGDFHGYILADIPGLIEGASEGRGLGHKFLRHIKRTKILLHCISLEEGDFTERHKTVRKELEGYDTELVEKKEIIVLTKTDTVSDKDLEKAKKESKKLNSEVLQVSVLDDSSIKVLREHLLSVLSEE